jgi:hypothetical protein
LLPLAEIVLGQLRNLGVIGDVVAAAGARLIGCGSRASTITGAFGMSAAFAFRRALRCGGRAITMSGHLVSIR